MDNEFVICSDGRVNGKMSSLKEIGDRLDAMSYGLLASTNSRPRFNYNECFGEYVRIPGIKKVIFNNPATVVYWVDGTKTVVKVGKNEVFDPEKGLAMAISKKSLGNQGNYYNEFKKWIGMEEKK